MSHSTFMITERGGRLSRSVYTNVISWNTVKIRDCAAAVILPVKEGKISPKTNHPPRS